MAISMEGSKPKNLKKIDVPAGWKFVHIFGLLPSFEMMCQLLGGSGSSKVAWGVNERSQSQISNLDYCT